MAWLTRSWKREQPDMFFTLGPSADIRLPCHDTMGSLIFSHDDGWELTDQGWSKGYITGNHGNWTQITGDKDIVIKHDQYRSYPLWWDSENRVLTNLVGRGESIWSDQTLRLVDGNLESTIVDVCGDINIDTLSMDSAAALIIDNLKNKLQQVIRDYAHLPKRLFISGGIDTVLLYALIKNQCIDCEILTYEHLEYNRFMDLNFEKIKQSHWGYSQIHHWTSPCMLFTGSCGDEFFMRGPNTVALWTAWHDINIEDVLQSRSGYHKGYYLLDKNIHIFRNYYFNKDNIKAQYPTSELLIKQILNMNVNDHQYWHLGQTLTWTPFKDLEITKTILRLSESDLLDQIVDAKFNKYLIEMLWPQALSLISDTKNHNSRENLSVLYT